MLRVSYGVLFAGPMLLAVRPSPSSDPPSSLRPVNRSGVVAISYDAVRIKSCVLESPGGERKCVGKREVTGGNTSVTLTPIERSPVDAPDPRKPITVTVSRGKRNVELGAGIWELQWPGHAGDESFRVEPGAEFAIKLARVRGSCRRVKQACALEPDVIVRRVEIPPGQRR